MIEPFSVIIAGENSSTGKYFSIPLDLEFSMVMEYKGYILAFCPITFNCTEVTTGAAISKEVGEQSRKKGLTMTEYVDKLLEYLDAIPEDNFRARVLEMRTYYIEPYLLNLLL